jgi:ribosome-binding factor A
MKRHRPERVAEAVREVAAETVLFKLRDPRVKMVTVTRAEVSGDLQHAKVFVSVMGSEREQQLTMHGLNHAAGFVQSRLAARLATRFVPEVTFVLDPGVKNALAVARILAEERRAAEGQQPGGPGGPSDQVETADGPAAGDS